MIEKLQRAVSVCRHPALTLRALMGLASRIEPEPRVLASGDWTLEPISPETSHDRKREGVDLQGDRRMIVEFRWEILDLFVFVRFIDSESVGIIWSGYLSAKWNRPI